VDAVADNIAPTGNGGGVASGNDSYASTVVRSSIISGNVNLDVEFFGPGGNPFQSGGHNLIGFGNATGAFSTYDQINNSDGLVDRDDLMTWLGIAGVANLPSHDPFLMGDADLNGSVDGQDFLVWNNNKFTAAAAWCCGDFNADGFLTWASFG
jgi:hypothetical protein